MSVIWKSYTFFSAKTYRNCASNLVVSCIGLWVQIFGRPLSVVSVCNVGVLWPNVSMDQDETWHGGGPRPWPVLDEDSAAPKKWHNTPTFWPLSIVAKRLDG